MKHATAQCNIMNLMIYCHTNDTSEYVRGGGRNAAMGWLAGCLMTIVGERIPVGIVINLGRHVCLS